MSWNRKPVEPAPQPVPEKEARTITVVLSGSLVFSVLAAGYAVQARREARSAKAAAKRAEDAAKRAEKILESLS